MWVSYAWLAGSDEGAERARVGDELLLQGTFEALAAASDSAEEAIGSWEACETGTGISLVQTKPSGNKLQTRQKKSG